MNTTTKWIVGIVVGIGVVVVGGVLAIAALIPTSRVVDGSPAAPVVPAPPGTEEPATGLSNGEWFGFVTVNGDNGSTVVTIDLAEILTGEEARKAAVDAGVIEEGEDVPNDFFIFDPEDDVEILDLADSAVIEVISGTSPETYLTIDADTLASLFNGSYSGEPVYGISPGMPAPMNITIEDGFVTTIESVYLP